VKLPPVQILVVVEITHARLMRTDVGKGSLGTAIDQGLAGPEPIGRQLPAGGPRPPMGERETGQ